MSQKFYKFNYLENYLNYPFIYERKSLETEKIYSYRTILKETTKCVEYFQQFQVENHAGIAVDIKEHTAATIVLLLSILNHDCHFYCLDLEGTKDAQNYLRLSGVKYIISTKIQKPQENSKLTIKELNIFDNIYYLDNFKTNKSFENVRLCYTIATSGSTGEPKMVHVPYECIEPNIKALSCLLNVKENDIIFLGSPPTFDPFVVELFLALKTGASVLITSKEIRLQPQQLLKVMFPANSTLKPGVTIFQTTPSLLRLFGKQIIHNEILQHKTSLRCLILGGEDFPTRLELQTWLPSDFSTSGKSIFNIYGITEVSCWSSICEWKNSEHSVTKTGGLGLPLGKPLDDFTFFRLVDQSGNILQHNNCKGELEIGSSIRRCFIPQLDVDENTKIIKSNNVIYRKTGDLVERDGSGNIYFIGRTNNTVKRLGKRLCLDSLNKKVEHLLNIKNLTFKVISLWHTESSKLIYYLVSDRNVSLEEKHSILDNLKQNLENHEQPDKILYSNELPLNRHGKVDRNKILNKILESKTSSPLKIFKDFLRNVLGFVWHDNEVTNSKEIETIKRLKLSTNVSFIEAGGNSFQALSLASEMADLMEHAEEQRKLLEMLLDTSITIEEILKFLMKVVKKIESSNGFHVQDLKSSFKFKQLWRFNLKKCIDASPTLFEEKFIAVGSHSHLLLTLNATTGEEISRLELNDRIECPVVFVSIQLALVGCYDGYLYGFDFNNGRIIWKLNVKGMIKAKPLVINNKVIVASYADDYNVMAFDLRSLTSIWSLKLGSKGIFSSPLQISEDCALFCTLDGTYASVEVETFNIKWLRKLESPIFSSASKIKISNECFIILAEVRGLITICNAKNGEKITTFQTEGNVFSGLTLHQPHESNNSFIIFGCHDKNVYCLILQHNTKDLTLHWKVPLNAAVFSTPIIISQHYIVACSTQGLMVILDVNEGVTLALYDIKAEVFSTPCCLKDKYLYVGSRDNYLYAFELKK